MRRLRRRLRVGSLAWWVWTGFLWALSWMLVFALFLMLLRFFTPDNPGAWM